ncbi:MAG: four helix bundle protein [Planctomycetes bacterium]|nr:four helix bundle protein [Planctomycetota bacterium]
MATFERFEDIKAWRSARELTRDFYRLCAEPRLAREFGLKDQLTRASLSIMNNIAEGFGRHGAKDFARFLTIAKASAIEVQSMLYVLVDLEAIDQPAFDGFYERVNKTIRMIGGLASYLRGEGADGPTQPITRNSEPGTRNS